MPKQLLPVGVHPNLPEDLGELVLEQSETLVKEQAAALRNTFSHYRSATKLVPDDCLFSSALRNVHRAATTLSSGSAPEPEQIEEAWVARERAEQGMSIKQTLDGYRLSHRVIRDGFLHACGSAHVDTRAALQGACLLWETADAGASQLLVVRGQFDLSQVQCGDDDQRLHLVRALLRGQLSAAQQRELDSTYGCRSDHDFLAVHATPLDDLTPDMLLRKIIHAGRYLGRTGILAVDAGVVVGIVPRLPSLPGVTAIVGVSTPVSLGALPGAFDSACRMSTVANRFGLRGVCGPYDLGLKVAVASEPELGQLMIDRYLGPLRAGSNVGHVLEVTLRQFFLSGRQAQRTARALGIHHNTLRYRLHKFEDLVKVDLEDPRTLAELWWTLEATSLQAIKRI